jgi:hypothetical protein
MKTLITAVLATAALLAVATAADARPHHHHLVCRIHHHHRICR